VNVRTLALALFVSCTCTQHVDLGTDDAGPPPEGIVSLTGRVCPPAREPGGFPIKVVAVVQNSAAMCVADGPGSQVSGSFCSSVPQPPNPTPWRVRALHQLINQLAPMSNASLAVVAFDSSPHPAMFAAPLSLLPAVDALPSELGKGSDYQSALEYSRALITNDIVETRAQNPELIPRSRYVVLIIGTGIPYPKCTAFDALSQYATPSMPELVWHDEPGNYCNSADPQDPNAIPGFIAGQDRNQFRQLVGVVADIKALQQAYNVGDVRVHALQILNLEAARNCGTLCQDVFGTWPATQPSEYFEAGRQVGEHFMKKFAETGGGNFFSALDSNALSTLTLAGIDFSSASSPWVLKTFLTQPTSSVPRPTERKVDADGDGIPDEEETLNAATHADSDSDCFSDGFEKRNLGSYFDPEFPDSRGCQFNCSCIDSDGDGLTQYEESYLGSSPALIDSDGDGLPDNLEALWGFDPAARSAQLTDSDFDGIDDATEIRQGSNPRDSDSEFRAKYAMHTALSGDGGCYDFTVDNVALVAGENRFRIFAAFAPQSVASQDYGDWRVACVTATFAPEVMATPRSVSVDASDFRAPVESIGCVGQAP
jgi:hypothetical protein